MKTVICIVIALVVVQSIAYAESDAPKLPPGEGDFIEIGHWSYDAIHYLDSREGFLEEYFENWKTSGSHEGFFSEQPQTEGAFGSFVFQLILEMMGKGYFSGEKAIDDTTLLIVKAIYEEHKQGTLTSSIPEELKFDLNDYDLFQNLEW